MPVVVNEIDILPAAEPDRATGASTATAAAAEPLAEQLRRLQRDLDGRQRRRMAD
jgi:hypothetical protein